MPARYLSYLFIVASLAAGPRIAQSQQPEDASSAALKVAVQAAWERSPQARTLEARLAEMDASREAASTWIAGSPSVGLAQRNSAGGERGGARESDVSLSAPVWLPAQKAARQSHASLGTSEVEAQIAEAKLGIAQEVREQMWSVAMAREALVAAQDHQHHLEQLADEVLLRVQAGDLSRADGLLAQQESLAAKAGTTEARMRLGQALSRYSMLTGLPAVPVPAREALPSSPPGPHPRVLAAQAALERARSSLDLANSIRSDPPTVGLLARREQERPGTGSANSIGVSIQIPLGTKARNRPIEAAANTRIASAAAELARAQRQTASEAELSREQLQIALQGLESTTARAALTREHFALMQKAFKVGERGLAELLRSEALSHEAAVAYRQQVIAVDLAHARRNQALGILP